MKSKGDNKDEEQELTDMNALHGLLRNIGIIFKLKNNYQILNQPFSDDFTVFSALGFEKKELKHNRILQALLDPKSAHGMGEEFLRLFFEMVLNKKYEPATVFLEHDIKYRKISGRLDLYIETENACYPIEVKITADDQETQICRYYNFAKKSGKREYTIFYLTLCGNKPKAKSTKGMNDEDIDNIKCISFKKDVLSWLRCCAEEAYKAKKISIYGAIRQYIVLIEKLTVHQIDNTKQEDIFMSSVEDIITLSSQYYKAAKAIAEKFKNVEPSKIKQIFVCIKSYLADNACVECDFDESKIYAFYKKKNRDYPVLKHEIKNDKNIKLFLIFEISDDGFYYGVAVENCNETKDIQKQNEFIKSLYSNNKWKEWVSRKPKDNDWVWWKWLPSKDENIDFTNCSGENYLRLYDPVEFDKIMKAIYQDIDLNIKYILKNGVPKDSANLETWPEPEK